MKSVCLSVVCLSVFCLFQTVVIRIFDWLIKIVVDNEIFVGGNFHGEYPAKVSS